MSRTPYTDTITTQLGINTDAITKLSRAHSTDTPIGQCANHILSTIWTMEAAERAARDALTDLTKQVEIQTAALTGTGRFEATWLTTSTRRAEEASAKLAAGTEELHTFKRLLDMLTTPGDPTYGIDVAMPKEGLPTFPHPSEAEVDAGIAEWEANR